MLRWVTYRSRAMDGHSERRQKCNVTSWYLSRPWLRHLIRQHAFGQKGCAQSATNYFRFAVEKVIFNPLKAELNPICHLLALLGGATIVVVSRLRVKSRLIWFHMFTPHIVQEKKTTKERVLWRMVPVLAHMESQKGIEVYKNFTRISLTDFFLLLHRAFWQHLCSYHIIL